MAAFLFKMVAWARCGHCATRLSAWRAIEANEAAYIAMRRYHCAFADALTWQSSRRESIFISAHFYMTKTVRRRRGRAFRTAYDDGCERDDYIIMVTKFIATKIERHPWLTASDRGDYGISGPDAVKMMKRHEPTCQLIAIMTRPLPRAQSLWHASYRPTPYFGDASVKRILLRALLRRGMSYTPIGGRCRL